MIIFSDNGEPDNGYQQYSDQGQGGSGENYIAMAIGSVYNIYSSVFYWVDISLPFSVENPNAGFTFGWICEAPLKNGKL